MSTLSSQVKFADAPVQIIDGDRGKNYPKQNEFSDQGHCLFLNASNVTPSGFQFSSCQFITKEKDEVLRKGKLKRDDIVMTTRGTLGNVAYYAPQVKYDHIRINSGMVIFRPNQEAILPAFLYHCLRSTSFRGQVKSLQSGVAQPQLPIRDIKRIELPLPSFFVQNKIASILSTYDNLIENNNRRIALLEESARLLYREWFVRLRFPGHEKTRIIDGVPEGWDRVSIADLSDSVRYGFTASASQEEVGPKFLRITDIVPSVIDWESVPYCAIEDNKKKVFALKEGDIVVARTGATTGYAKRINKRHPEAVFASYLVRIRLKESVDDLLVGVFVESDEYKGYIKAHLGGAAQPNANAKIISGATFLLPPVTIQKSFRDNIGPNYDQIELLQIQNQKLKAARNLLLPKLINGELPV